MSKPKTTSKPTATTEQKILERQRKRANRLLLKKRREKSGQ